MRKQREEDLSESAWRWTTYEKVVSKVLVFNTLHQVEYEGFNMISFQCGRYGHRQEDCPYVREVVGEEKGFSFSDLSWYS